MATPGHNGKRKETSMVLDLSDFVKEVDRFSHLIEPFALIFYTIDDIRRWRFRNGTIVVWLLCNIACIWLTQAAVFVCASSLVIAIATLCLFQIHTRILDKILPSLVKSQAGNESSDVGGALDTVQNFRYSLIEMHDFVIKSNEYLGYFYSILRWDSTLPSLIYHTEACLFLLSLVICPARWNCLLFINWFFLCHPHILKKCFRHLHQTWLIKSSSPSTRKSSNQGQSNEAKELCKGKEKKSKDYPHLVDGEEFDDDDDDDDADSSDLDMTDVVGDESMIELDPSPSKPGMVARLMEIKKRRKQIANESCLGCNVSFASLLKKRLYCRHCGNSFCNHCCYQKVPRSVFGATSPAAMKETVLVCCTCHSLLVNKKDESEICPSETQVGEIP